MTGVYNLMSLNIEEKVKILQLSDVIKFILQLKRVMNSLDKFSEVKITWIENSYALVYHI